MKTIPLPLTWYLILGAVVFCIGIFGILTRRNAVGILMSIELLLNSVNINLVAFSKYIKPMPGNELAGQVFAIFVMVIAAAEASVGLAIILSVYRNLKDVSMDKINIMKW